MAQADFAYQPANDAGTALAVSIFADSAMLREQMRDDAADAGLLVRECGAVAELLDAEVRPLGEVVLLDCPEVRPADVAALVRLDERAARSGAHLVISTSAARLEDVFACCERSAPQILVDPNHGERIVALGNVLARIPNLRLRELSGDDRITLLRLTEQVGEIAARLERMGAPGLSDEGGAFRFASPAPDWHGPKDGERRLIRSPRPPLPDPRLVRQIIRQRRLRSKFFDGELFADPAWDILLDLTAARAEHARVSVTSLCIASGVPPTTALRWIGQMTSAGLLERVEDESDRRRAFIALSEKAADAMARYFAELGKAAAAAI
ncbi:winged helix DNA-binding protein [Croceibacterium aestuarii]|uniref:winged helix DNA-binding protein n=1 Tax=Croceibacterium aestuarii TaxID=3064139 RepID=UPI00272E3903|nr:winged helix DNA-binding protein [Croceibacterium sp. D39]